MEKIILHLETSTTNCSVALSKGKEIIYQKDINDGYSHAENLSPLVDEALKAHNLKVSDLDAVSVGKGPGSYTGLRIGVSTAKGLCYGAKLPLISINSLESLAIGIKSKVEISIGIIIPMIDARRMEVYCQLFDSELIALNEIEAKILDESSFANISEPLFIGGDGAAKALEVVQKKDVNLIENILPSASNNIEIALSKFRNNDFEDVAYFEPFYLKDFVAGKPKKRF